MESLLSIPRNLFCFLKPKLPLFYDIKREAEIGSRNVLVCKNICDTKKCKQYGDICDKLVCYVDCDDINFQDGITELEPKNGKLEKIGLITLEG